MLRNASMRKLLLLVLPFFVLHCYVSGTSTATTSSMHNAHNSRSQPANAPTFSSAVIIQVNGTQRYQTFTGFGASLTTFEQDGIFKAHDHTQPQKVTATKA